VEAMIAIREEIKEIEDGMADRSNNVFHNAPHTAAMVITSDWNYPYTREKAAFPLPGLRTDKYFHTCHPY
jgi:glycine dehydrogenase